MPKKVAPFWAFFQVYDRSQRHKARNLTREEMLAEASAYWEELAPDDRTRFVEDAQQRTQDFRRMISHRIEASRDLARESATSNAVDNSLEEINRRTLANLKMAIKASAGGIRAKEFTFLQVNTQISAKDFPAAASIAEGLHPLEMSLCRFSIDKGITGRWHGMLKPWTTHLSRNEKNQAELVCRLTHAIPLEGAPGAARSPRKFWKSASEFIRGSPLVVTANLPENMGAFIFLLQKSQIKEVPPIIDVEGFVECIRYCADDDNVFGEAAALKAFDAKDFEEDEVDMACSFHLATKAGVKFCTLLQVTRMAFESARVLCEVFKVEPLLAGAHTAVGRAAVLPVHEFKEPQRNSGEGQGRASHRVRPQHLLENPRVSAEDNDQI